jgi:hypothetical protein
VLVAPAVGEPLPEPRAADLPAQLGLEPAASVAGAGRHGTFEIAQLGPHIGLQRANDAACELHQRRPVGWGWSRVDSAGTGSTKP